MCKKWYNSAAFLLLDKVMTKLEELQKLLLSKGMTEEEFELMLPFLMGAFTKHLEAKISTTFSADELTEMYSDMEKQDMKFADKMEFMDKKLSKKGNFSIRRFYEDFLQDLIESIEDIYALLETVTTHLKEYESEGKDAQIKRLNDDLEALYQNKLEEFQKDLLAKI